jgi:hypothetical protein
MITGSFLGVKRPGRGVEHPPPFRVGVKESVELYLHSPSALSRPVLGLILPLPLLFMEIPAVYCENHIKYMRKLALRGKMCFEMLRIEILVVTTCTLTQKKALNIDNILCVCLFLCHKIFQESKKEAIIFLHNVNGLILFFMVALPLVLCVYHSYRKIYRLFVQHKCSFPVTHYVFRSACRTVIRFVT